MTSSSAHIFLNRRASLLGGLGLLGGVALSACQPQKAEALPVLRASLTGKGEGDWRLLQKTSNIRPQGFEVAYSQFQGGNLVVEALNGGSLDFGSMSEIPPIFALGSGHLSFRQIGIAHGDVNNQVVLLPKGSKIESLKDLKGKRIGYVRATTSQYFLIRMLESVGLSWADITPVALGVNDGAAAFTQGSLDAWAIYGFPIQRAISLEGARILKTALGILSGNYPIVAHVDALADPKKVELIRGYLKFLREGFAWAAANQAQWAKVIATDIGVPLEYVEDQFKRRSDVYTLRPVTPEAIVSQQQVADVFTKAGVLTGKVDVAPLWDNRFNDFLSKEA
jgi:sulfonate transport system substrate-binding protein